MKTSISECLARDEAHGSFGYRRKRLGDAEIPLRAGDYFAFPAGPPGHQIINRSGEVLRYLALSTKIDPEVSVYPDSGKVGTWSDSGGDALFRSGSAVDDYEGEE